MNAPVTPERNSATAPTDPEPKLSRDAFELAARRGGAAFSGRRSATGRAGYANKYTRCTALLYMRRRYARALRHRP